MLCVISPAKRLDERPQPLPDGIDLTEPDFLTETWRLIQSARAQSVDDLRRLMDLSEPLARLNHDRFKAFRRKPAHAFAAVQCFAGDTYAGLEAATMTADCRHWARGHLRILSGLYGLLRPWDAIQPHRLEMGTRLENPRGADLYAFWGDRVAKALTKQAAEAGTTTLLNCASVEYFTVAQRRALKLRVITPVFHEERGGEAKVVSFWAKKARGAMARFLCDNHLTDPADLRGFTAGGYTHRPDQSSDDRVVFARAEPQEAAA
jgi:cytoplasmic iron level regulating protein YaaA (DUF328/UPF0246 family)